MTMAMILVTMMLGQSHHINNDHPDNLMRRRSLETWADSGMCFVNLANVVILVLKTGKLTNPIETRAE